VNKDKYEYFTIAENDSDKRIDSVIRRFLPLMPLKNIFKSIRSGDIRVNNLKVKQNHKLKIGDTIAIYKPYLQQKKTDTKNVVKEIDRDRVIYENRDILIYNKPRGVLVHGEKNSLDFQIRNYLKDKVEESLSFSPGPLHRLDRNTQGLIAFSVSLNGAREFTNLLKNGGIRKFYIAVVDGIHSKKEVWKDSISRNEMENKSYVTSEGKISETIFKPIFSKDNYTIALLEIKTGRTHQIRVQCSAHNKPLTGDIKYNKNTKYKKYYLSAISLSFVKKSDIIDINNISMPFSKISDSLISNLFTSQEIKNIDMLIQKELERV